MAGKAGARVSMTGIRDPIVWNGDGQYLLGLPKAERFYPSWQPGNIQVSAGFTESEEVGAVVVTLIYPFLLYQFGDGLQVTFANALRGISDVKPMIIIAFIAYFIISLPIGYIFGFLLDWGVFGVWMAFPFGLTGAGIMLYLRFRSRFISPAGK